MNKTFYRSLVTNKIFDSSDLERFCQIDNGVSFKNLLDAKKIIVIDKSLEEKYSGLDSCSRTSETIVCKNRIFSAGIPLKMLTNEICSDII